MAARTSRAGRPEKTEQHIAVALSGGGHRASLFGLGALLYLVDAGKGPEVATVSSISGGSLTNGFVGMTTDLTEVEAAEFWDHARTFARSVASVGTVWAAPLTYVYLGVLAALFAVVGAAVVIGGLAGWVLGLVALVGVGGLAQQRSWVAAKSFDRAVFNGAALSSMKGRVDHVICSADLQSAEHVYFSGRFVNSYRTGWGVPGELPLARAVQSSAALPGAFNPVSLPLDRHRFPAGAQLGRFLLTDGGVYDNMGTEWPVNLRARLEREGVPSPPPNSADELIVVNASAGTGITDRRSVRWPIVGELTLLLAVKDVLYDQTTAVRRRWLDLRFRSSRDGGGGASGGLEGALVQIDRSPFALPDAFQSGGDAMAKRAKSAIEVLDERQRDAWAISTAADKGVKTALSKIPAERAASLIRHAYVLTMVNSHVLLDYPLLPIPDQPRFDSLVS